MVCNSALIKTGFSYFTSFIKKKKKEKVAIFSKFPLWSYCTVNQTETFVGGQDFRRLNSNRT